MLTRWLYFRLFGLTALLATGAYWLQVPGLGLSTGAEPIAQTADWLRERGRFVDTPTLLWLSSSDAMIQALCGASVVFALLIFFDAAVPFALLGLFLAWTSLVNVAQPFLSFQWDVMLCEAALLSIAYAVWPKHQPQLWQRLFVALVAVKVTFESGVVKLTAGDASWWPDLTALTYHYWTQPLPTWTSVYIDRLPLGVHQASCAIMFALELGVPFAAFGPRAARRVAAFGMIALQSGLALAGNYSYFNMLAGVLCLPLLDDDFFRRMGDDVWPTLPASEKPQPRWLAPVGTAAFVVTAVLGALVFVEQYGFKPLDAVDRLEAFKASSSYGAFRVMTKTRPEIIIEGSDDGVTWKAYGFHWKPGRLDRRPTFIAPWQPRLDWQMWFAALSSCGNNRWLVNTLRQLMLGTPEVLALFEENPFPERPPRLIRTTRWQYRFADAGSADWWQRSEPEPYCPTVTLDAQGGIIRAQ